MSSTSSFTAAGVRCFRREGEPRTFYYVPGPPSAKPDAAGKPALTLLAFGAGGLLQLEARWWVPAEQLAAVRAALAERFPEEDAEGFELVPAPATVGGVTLLEGDGDGELAPLATAVSSGFPPYSAVFSLRLDERQKEHAVACLHGREGFLALTYEVALELVAGAVATVEGEVAADLAALAAEPSIEECRRRIEEALAAGRLALTLEADEAAPEELRAEVEEAAKAQAALILQGIRADASGSPPTPEPEPGSEARQARLRARAERSVRVAVEEKPTADLATWFEAGEGASRLKVAPGAARPEPPAAKSDSRKVSES